MLDIEKAAEFEREPLIKPSSKTTKNKTVNVNNEDKAGEEEPFSLNGLKKLLKYPLKVYENFAVSNAASIESIESTLRSISYILPGTANTIKYSRFGFNNTY